MKNLLLTLLLTLTWSPISMEGPILSRSSQIDRSLASIENVKKLIEIDERRGCCSHHGGVSHCSNGTLYCNDGWISGCGC